MRDDGQPGRSRAAAAEALLNRGWGSPTHAEMDVREQPPLLPYTGEELLQRLQAHVNEKRERAKSVN